MKDTFELGAVPCA